MDPLSIAAASFAIAGAVARASVAIFEFSREAKDASDDLSRVNSELQALTSILDPLARSLSKATPEGMISAGLAHQLESSLSGCALVLGQLEVLIRKYQREGAWTRTKWVVLGRVDVEKLRESLEAYKMALSLGLHVISLAIEENIQRDTGALRNDTRILQEYAAGIKVNTDEILARVNSIRHGRWNDSSSTRVHQWIEEIEILTSYAETTSQAATLRAEDFDDTDDPDGGQDMPLSSIAEAVSLDDFEPEAPVQDPEGVGASPEVLGVPVGPKSHATLPINGSKAIRAVRPEGHHLRTAHSFLGKRPSQRPTDSSETLTDRFYAMLKALGSLAHPKNVSDSDDKARAAIPGPSHITQGATSSTSGESGASTGFLGVPHRQSAPETQFVPTQRVIKKQPKSTGNEPPAPFKPAGEGKLDLVIAIDIGDTSTAVAWMTQDEHVRQTISAWPGGSGARVPTSVAYNAQGSVSSWGFECGQDTCPDTSLTAMMDDADDEDNAPVPPYSNRRRLTHFLRRLYNHIRGVISSALAVEQYVWTEMAIEFHFTLPDAFRRALAPERKLFTDKLKDILRSVGIGTERYHYAMLGLTEMEAVSIVELKKRRGVKYGALLAIVSDGSVMLLGHDPNAKDGGGYYVGWVECLPRFDDVFVEYVSNRRRLYRDSRDKLRGLEGWDMVQGSDFRAIAAAIKGSAPRQACYTLRADSIPPSFRHEGLGIADGGMRFTHQQVKDVQSRRFKEAADFVDKLIQSFSKLTDESGTRLVYRRLAHLAIVSKEVTKMTAYLADMVPVTLRTWGQAQVTTSSLPDEVSQEAAVWGALTLRNAWSFRGLPTQIRFLGDNPLLQVRLRKPPGPLQPVGELRCWRELSPHAGGKATYEFRTEPGRLAAPLYLHLEVFYTFLGTGRNQASASYSRRRVTRTESEEVTRLCTVKATVPEKVFGSRLHWNKESMSFQRFYVGWVALRFLAIDAARAGPTVEVLAGDRPSPAVRCEADVTWYSEPPNVVWQREYAEAPVEDKQET